MATEPAARRFWCRLATLLVLGLGPALALDGGRASEISSPARASRPAKSPAKSPRSERPATAPAAERVQARMNECRQQIHATLHPAQVIRLSEACAREVPAGPLAEELRRLGSGARAVLEILRSSGLSADLFDDPIGDDDYRDNLHKAVRGDKDAAYRIAISYRAGLSGVAASTRRTEQWLRFSAELGNGLASWELAEFYNYRGLVGDAARFEKKAIDLGYRPPFRLPTRGY